MQASQKPAISIDALNTAIIAGNAPNDRDQEWLDTPSHDLGFVTHDVHREVRDCMHRAVSDRPDDVERVEIRPPITAVASAEDAETFRMPAPPGAI